MRIKSSFFIFIAFFLINKSGYCQGIPSAFNSRLHFGAISAESNYGGYIAYDLLGGILGTEAQSISDTIIVNAYMGVPMLLNNNNMIKFLVGYGTEEVVLKVGYEYLWKVSSKNRDKWAINIGYQKYTENEELSGAQIGMGFVF